jgi:hypothetical protein
MNINPAIMTNAAGSFSIHSDGVICGTAYPDPATRFALAGGILDDTETLPMWGGVAIDETIPSTGIASPRPELGGHIKRAVDDAHISGFSVYDQNYAAINAPQSQAPQTGPGGFVAFYRLGCGQRVALELDPALATSLEGDPILQQIGWDFVNQRIITGTGLNVRVIRTFASNCMAAFYTPANQFLNWNRNAAAAICIL